MDKDAKNENLSWNINQLDIVKLMDISICKSYLEIFIKLQIIFKLFVIIIV